MSATESSAAITGPESGLSPDYDGMRVDVYDEENRPVFEAKLKVIDGSLVLLERTSDAAPALADSTPVHIRGFHPARNLGVHMRGRLVRLAPTQTREWIVKDLNMTGADRGRIFSRTYLRAKAWIAPSPEGPWQECTAVNASAGGVRVQTDRPLESGARIFIRFHLRPGREQPPLACLVHQGVERNGVWEHGCEFVDITEEVEGVIAKTIIELQIMR